MKNNAEYQSIKNSYIGVSRSPIPKFRDWCFCDLVAKKDILDVLIENNQMRHYNVLLIITITFTPYFGDLLNKWFAMIEKQLVPFT